MGGWNLKFEINKINYLISIFLLDWLCICVLLLGIMHQLASCTPWQHFKSSSLVSLRPMPNNSTQASHILTFNILFKWLSSQAHWVQNSELSRWNSTTEFLRKKCVEGPNPNVAGKIAFCRCKNSVDFPCKAAVSILKGTQWLIDVHTVLIYKRNAPTDIPVYTSK